jgi:hypothetical protein
VLLIELLLKLQLVISTKCSLARKGFAGKTHDQGHSKPCASAVYVPMLTNITNYQLPAEWSTGLLQTKYFIS